MGRLSRLLLTVGLTVLCASQAAADAADAVALDAASTIAVAGATSASDAGSVSAESVQVAEPATSPSPSGWQFSAAPYFWMAGMKGDMGVVEEVEPVGVDLSFFDIMGALKFALMGSFEARNGRFVGTADMLYLSLSASDNITIREADFLDVKLGSKTFLMTGTAGYRVLDQGRLYIDLFGGGRLNSMKTTLDLEGPQRSFSGSKTETWIDPIVGARSQVPLGPKWTLQAYGDVGGFGIASHSTWQLLGTVQYDLSSRWSLSGGWRHLKTNYDHNGFVFDVATDGPILGAVYRF